MVRIADVVVQYDDNMTTTVAYHHQIQDLRIGSQIVVGPAQQAIFVRDGKALDAFGPGRHTVTTANIPLLTGLLSNIVFGGNTPFQASIFYTSTREFPQLRWGTVQPIALQTPGIGLGWLLIGAHGNFGVQLSDPQTFLNQFVGFIRPGSAYTIEMLRERMVSLIVQALTDLVTETGPGTLQKAQSMMDEFASGVQAKIQEEFAAMGFRLTFFRFGGFSPQETSAKALRDMGLLDAGTYAVLQQADAILAAGNKGVDDLAGLGAVLAGKGVLTAGGIPVVAGAAQAPAQAPQPAAAAAPDVMSAAQAAAYVQVSEADIIAAIDAGELKARKIGNSYRISKAAIDEYLKG
ncbi:MAG: helix-turn-helix domain-containing protein [Chloroflexi bacterium]|nr:helix-turn-helix domain-containing protein [Chloroflexota bacterium]